MTNKINKDKEIDILLEEYKQLYEHARHNDNIASNKEAIFAVAAFGVLAYFLKNDLEICKVIGAAVVSIALYLYHVLAFNRMSFFQEVDYARLREIEARVNDLSCSKEGILCFQMKYDKYEEKAQKKHSKCIGIRCMQRIMVGLLLSLWVVLIVTKIFCKIWSCFLKI